MFFLASANVLDEIFGREPQSPGTEGQLCRFVQTVLLHLYQKQRSLGALARARMKGQLQKWGWGG